MGFVSVLLVKLTLVLRYINRGLTGLIYDIGLQQSESFAAAGAYLGSVGP